MVAHQLGAGDLAAANRLSKIDELLVNACRRYREARLVITLYGQKTSLVLSSSCSSSSSATVCLVSSWVEPQRGQESSAPPIWIQHGEYHLNISTSRGQVVTSLQPRHTRCPASQPYRGGPGGVAQHTTHTCTRTLYVQLYLQLFI